MWICVISVVAIFMILRELIRLPTIGKYSERYVFITGCDTGFGNMLAKRLDSLGFNVFAGCFTERGADELKKESSARLKTLTVDVSNLSSIKQGRKFVVKRLPENKGLWAIVNNAGIAGNMAPSEMLTTADYRQCLDVNLYGVINVTRVFQPLVRKGQGRVVNMASMAGRMAAFFAPYAVSKYGVEAFTDCFRREVLKQGITAHIIEPGFFKTEINDANREMRQALDSYHQTEQDVQRYNGKPYVETALNQIATLIQTSRSPKTYKVVDAYTHAITAIFPRYRYVVGPDKHMHELVWNLPEWVSDRIISRHIPQPDGVK